MYAKYTEYKKSTAQALVNIFPVLSYNSVVAKTASAFHALATLGVFCGEMDVLPLAQSHASPY